MITKATITGPDGPIKLLFGIYGLKQFTKRMGCDPDINSILMAFTGGTRIQAITEIVRAGYEHATAENSGVPEQLTEFEACKILEKATEKEAEMAMKAFLSSIVGQDYDEWFTQLEKDAKQAEARANEAQKKTEKKSQPGKKSNPKLSEKSESDPENSSSI